jgi:hypothetical protein
MIVPNIRFKTEKYVYIDRILVALHLYLHIHVRCQQFQDVQFPQRAVTKWRGFHIYHCQLRILLAALQIRQLISKRVIREYNEF